MQYHNAAHRRIIMEMANRTIRYFLTLCVLVVAACAPRYATHGEAPCPTAHAMRRVARARGAAGVFRGVVRDRDSGLTLAEAFLQLPESAQTVLSDSLGRFSFSRLQPGRYAVTIRRIGYERYTDTVAITARDGVEAEFALIPGYGFIEGRGGVGEVHLMFNVMQVGRNDGSVICM